MVDQPDVPPAGWYDDPTAADQQRWWDGSQWTASTRPTVDSPLPPPPAVPAHQAPGPPPQPVGAPGPTGAAASFEPPTNRSSGARTVVIVLGVLFLGVALLGGCVAALVAVRAGTSEGTIAADETADAVPVTGEDEDQDEDADADQPEEDRPATAAGSDDGGDGRRGTRDDPLPYDQPVDLTWTTFGDADGSVWTTVVGPPSDITDEVLADNEFNDPPPEGARFVGFDVELTLVDAPKEPLAPGFNLTWEIIGGATARPYDPATLDTSFFGCGVLDRQFDDFAEAFVGGTLSGTVCIPLPEDDLGHPDTRVAIHFTDDTRAYFG